MFIEILFEILFYTAFGLIVWGISMLSVPAAVVLVGLFIGLYAILLHWRRYPERGPWKDCPEKSPWYNCPKEKKAREEKASSE